ncbi:MAG: iron-containing alcohol dehydrogenase, partial [Nitrospinota bacterium]
MRTTPPTGVEGFSNGVKVFSMLQYNFPTTIFYGTGALNQLGRVMGNKMHKKVLIVTDGTLVKLGIVKSVIDVLEENRVDYVLYDETHSNPVEEDVEKGAASFKKNKCD